MNRHIFWLRLSVVALAVVVVLGSEIIGSLTEAHNLGWVAPYTVMHTAVGLCYALCAWIAWRSAESPVPGRFMVAIAFLWLPPTFVAACGQIGWLWPVLDGLGIVWAVLAGVLVVVYPNGRLHGRVDVALLVVATVAMSVRFVAALLFNQPVNASRLVAHNPYAIVDGDAIFIAVDRGFRFLGVVLLLIIVVVTVTRWMRGGTPARHIALVMPVALVLWAAAIAYETVMYSIGGEPLEMLRYVSLAATAAVPVSFVIGLSYLLGLRGRVSDLMVLTRDGVDRALWQNMLAETLHDPTVRVFWWEKSRARYVNALGETSDPLTATDAHRSRATQRSASLLPIATPDGPLAMIRYNSALNENSSILEAVSTAVQLSVDNDQLRDQLHITLQEVRESRLRIVDAGIEARRHIERDLHDGSQQSLVALALNLRMAASKAQREGQHEIARDIEASLELLADALKQLRELARGIHPTSLTIGGLSTAVPELVAQSPIPIETTVARGIRLPDVVEATIYFFVAECLTNIAKYAEAHRGSVVVAARDQGIFVQVADDGKGGAIVGAGSGLRGLIDRVETLGGRVEVHSEPLVGTTITAWIPLAASPE